MINAIKRNYLKILKILNRVFLPIIVILMFVMISLRSFQAEELNERKKYEQLPSQIEINFVEKDGRLVTFELKNNSDLDISSVDVKMKIKDKNSDVNETFRLNFRDAYKSNTSNQISFRFNFESLILSNTNGVEIEYSVMSITLSSGKYVYYDSNGNVNYI